MKKSLLITVFALVYLSVFATDQPEWVKKPSVMNTESRVFANGNAKKQTKSMTLKAALLDAQVNLAGYINTAINSVTRSMREEVSSSGESLESVEYFSEVVESNVKADLSLVQQEDIYKDEDGVTWVLVSMPLEFVLNQISNSVKKVTKEDERNSSVMKKYAEEIRTRSQENFSSFFKNDNGNAVNNQGEASYDAERYTEVNSESNTESSVVS